jgi:myosin heavy subunit
MTSEETAKTLAWINTILQPHHVTIRSLQELSNGYSLCLLAEELSGKKIEKKNPKPSHPAHKVSNATYALETFKQLVQNSGCTANDILDGNEKLMLALLSRLHKFSVDKQKVKSGDESDKLGERSQPIGLSRSTSYLTISKTTEPQLSPRESTDKEVLRLKKQVEELQAQILILTEEKTTQLQSTMDQSSLVKDNEAIHLKRIGTMQEQLDQRNSEIQQHQVELSDTKKELESTKTELSLLKSEFESYKSTQKHEFDTYKNESTTKIQDLLATQKQLHAQIDVIQHEKDTKPVDTATTHLVQNLTDRIEKYSEGILKIQENHFAVVEKLGQEKELELANQRALMDEEMKKKLEELEETHLQAINDVEQNHKIALELITKEYKNREVELILNNDLLKNPDIFGTSDTLGRQDSGDQLQKRMSTPHKGALSEKAQKLLVGKSKDSPQKK